MLLNVMMHSDKNPPVQHLIYTSVKLTVANFVLCGDLLLAFVRCWLINTLRRIFS